MGVTYNFQELLNLENVTLSYYETWAEYLSTLADKIGIFVGSDSLTGEGADAMKSYMVEMHSVVISQLQTYLEEMVRKVTLYVSQIFSMDSDVYAIIDSFTLAVCNTNFTGFKSDYDSEVTSLQTILGEIDDLYTPPFITPIIIDTDYDDIITMTTDLKTQIEEFDVEENAMQALPLEAYHMDIYRVIAEATEGKTVSIDSYQSGDFRTLEAYEAAEARQQQALAYSALVDEAYQSCLGMVASANEYVAAVEAQKDNAIIHGIEAGLCFAAGVAVIVATWGAATPVVVGGGICATGCASFGVAETVEAYNSYQLYLDDDGVSAAFNPIRDVYCGGDQAKYDVAKKIVMDVSGLYGNAVTVYGKATAQYLVYEGGEYILKTQTDDVCGYVIVSTVEKGIQSYVIDEASGGLTSVVIEAYEQQTGNDVAEWQEKLLEETIKFGGGKIGDNFTIWNGEHF